MPRVSRDRSNAVASPTNAGGLTAEQERVVEQNMPLVHHIVARITDRFPSGFSREDLVQAGSVGLVEAVCRFEPERGFAFSTFAGRRIEGAVLDALRSADWASRSVRMGERELRQADAQLAASLGRKPTEHELARAMGVDRQRLENLRSDLSRARVDSLTTGGADEDSSSRRQIDVPVAGDEQRRLEEKELFGYLRDAIHLLPDRHRLVIVGYFLEGKSITELGALLGVSQSRASQLKGEALAMMRSGLSSAIDDGPQAVSASTTQSAYNQSLQDASSWRDRLVGFA